MRIALISPFSRGPMRGNITTTQRLARFLARAGTATMNLAADALSVSDMERQLAEFRPDLIHGLHAGHCGSITRRLAGYLRKPYVITIVGSDINEQQMLNQPETSEAIGGAQAVVCFDDWDAALLARNFPHLGSMVAVIPQGVEPLDVLEGETFGLLQEHFVLLLPAALRPVKQAEFPLLALPQLAQGLPNLRLVIAGGVIDHDYAATIRRMLCDVPFAQWLGEVPHDRMGSLYHRADLVLNCSRSESMPNSLLEAMALGRPVLAANIPGNRSLVQNGETGWLYDDEAGFRGLVLKLTGDAPLREQTGRHARERMMADFSPQAEAERYLSLYRKVSCL